MNERRLSILMLACGGSVSHGLLKALALSDLSCRVVGADIAPNKAGLYTVDRAYISPWAHEPRFMDWLLETCRDERIDAVLSGAEPVIGVLAEHKERVRQETGAICLVTDPATYRIGDDKLLCCEWLTENGFNCPAYAASEDKAGLDRLAETCRFPLVAKARIGGGAEGMIEVQNGADLEYVSKKSGYIVQECIGTPDAEFTVGCFCDRQGALRGTIVFRRGLRDGSTVDAEVGEFPEVRAEAERIVNCLKPQGPCNVQLRLRESKAVCFEMNVRFSGTAPVRARFGFNEVDAALRHFVLGEDEISLPTVTKGVMVRYWNEMYVDPGAYDELKTQGRLNAPGEHPLEIEDYGMGS